MTAKITAVSGIEIKGCLVINYQGFDMSISTIPNVPEIRIFGATRFPGTDMTSKIMGDGFGMPVTLKSLAKIKRKIDLFVGL